MKNSIEKEQKYHEMKKAFIIHEMEKVMKSEERRNDLQFLSFRELISHYDRQYDSLNTLYKEINRTNLAKMAVESKLNLEVVERQLEMIRLRNTSKAFEGNVEFEDSSNDEIRIRWSQNEEKVSLIANLSTLKVSIQGRSENGDFHLDL